MQRVYSDSSVYYSEYIAGLYKSNLPRAFPFRVLRLPQLPTTTVRGRVITFALSLGKMDRTKLVHLELHGRTGRLSRPGSGKPTVPEHAIRAKLAPLIP